MPRLSIGLPVYNGAAYLRECVASILSQDLTDLELILSDNASTDGSDAIASEFARADRRVRVVRQATNLGAAGNFNAVFALANAPYFKWACADDAMQPGFLSRAVAELDAHPEAVMCYGATTLVDADGKSLGESTQDLDLRTPNVIARFRHARDHRGLLHVLQGVWRRSALEGTALFGAFPGSDEVLVVEVSLRGTFHEIASPMLRRRMHAAAASADKTVTGRQEHLDPRTRGRIVLYFWQHAFKHLGAVMRAPLSIGMRARLVWVVLRSMIGSRNDLGRELMGGIRQLLRRRVGGSAAAKRA